MNLENCVALASTLDAQPYPSITPKSNETYELHNIVKELRNINNRNL